MRRLFIYFFLKRNKIYDSNCENFSDGRSRRDDFGLVSLTWPASARLDEREMAEVAATVQDTKDTVQGILWAANIIMGQLYEIFINWMPTRIPMCPLLPTKWSFISCDRLTHSNINYELLLNWRRDVGEALIVQPAKCAADDARRTFTYPLRRRAHRIFRGKRNIEAVFRPSKPISMEKAFEYRSVGYPTRENNLSVLFFLESDFEFRPWSIRYAIGAYRSITA